MVEAKPLITPDNGPQFVSKDFKEFIRMAGMSHVRTSPFYQQSNGKLERYHRTIKTECFPVKRWHRHGKLPPTRLPSTCSNATKIFCTARLAILPLRKNWKAGTTGCSKNATRSSRPPEESPANKNYWK
ncbi:MAG: transposase family protein [Chlorobiaceae bacterium]|nr:transposase family protein [Chlorobiaceae bacterium]NTW75250.1 transposase family protein [Chlorobiaceae bacterium]